MAQAKTLLDKTEARSMLRQLYEALRVVDNRDTNVYMHVLCLQTDGRDDFHRVYNTASGAIGAIIEALDTTTSFNYDLYINTDTYTTYVYIYGLYPRAAITATIRRVAKMEGGV